MTLRLSNSGPAPVSPEDAERISKVATQTIRKNVIRKALFGRVDSWIGELVARKLWAAVFPYARGLLFEKIRLESGQFNREDFLRDFCIHDPKRFTRITHINGTLRSTWSIHQYIPIIRLGRHYAYVNLDDEYNGVDLYVPRSARPEIDDILFDWLDKNQVSRAGWFYDYRLPNSDDVSDRAVYWDTDYNPRLKISLDSIPMHSVVRERLMDIKTKMDIAWRSEDSAKRQKAMCIMLEGPRGSGKSTLALALAYELDAGVYRFPNTSSADLFWLLARSMTAKAVVLADEADKLVAFSKVPETLPAANLLRSSAMPMRVEEMLEYQTGPSSIQSVLTIACTNNKDGFDPRTTRTGRMEPAIHVGEVDDAGIKYWLSKNHNRTLGNEVHFEDMLVCDIFASFSECDDVDKFIAKHSTPTKKSLRSIP